MSVTFSIDWLHITDPLDEVVPLRLHMHPLLNDRVYTTATPHYGYTEAVTNVVGAIAMSNPLRADMGIHVGYSATALNGYEKHGFEALTILRWHLGKKASIARIDLAFDLYNTGLDIPWLFSMLENDHASTAARVWNMIIGHDGGKTLYVGSRSSEAMIRIYDKAVEQCQKGDWKRVEIELKGDKANITALELANREPDTITSYAKDLLNGICYFPDFAWIAAFGWDAVPIASASKKQTDTLNWLLNVAAPTLGKHMTRTNDQSLLARFLRIVRINRRKSE